MVCKLESKRLSSGAVDFSDLVFSIFATVSDIAEGLDLAPDRSWSTLFMLISRLGTEIELAKQSNDPFDFPAPIFPYLFAQELTYSTSSLVLSIIAILELGN